MVEDFMWILDCPHSNNDGIRAIFSQRSLAHLRQLSLTSEGNKNVLRGHNFIGQSQLTYFFGVLSDFFCVGHRPNAFEQF